jgi:uncharacterized protein YdeI (YjbR/CyaY-like superfamily)
LEKPFAFQEEMDGESGWKRITIMRRKSGLSFLRFLPAKAGSNYSDAVEEALSFGWIDSTVKSTDENFTVQRFTPRNPKSRYSQANIERLRWLVKEGKVIPSVRDSIRDILNEEFVIPEDILKEIKSNTEGI